MNGVNLNQFQFEYDLTWMAFFQNSLGRTYLRYGGREDHDAESQLTKDSLVRAMRQALVLHERGDALPANRYNPLPDSARTPADIPPMKAMIERRKSSCIHCHDVKVARLRHARDQGTLRKEMVFTYPPPSTLGIHTNPDIQYRVDRVDEPSVAAAAGIRAGDLIRQVDGQRVLTFADFTRVLELAADSGVLEIAVERNGELLEPKTVQLTAGWRKTEDPSWRASGGAVGPNAGLWGVVASDNQRRQLGVGPDDLAIRVTFVYKPWPRGAGIRLNDYIVSIDGQSHHMTTRQLQSYLHQNTNWGDTIELEIRRGDQKRTVEMTFPDSPPD